MPEVDIITGGSRVRHWTEEEKVSILQAAFAPGAITAHVAKRMNECFDGVTVHLA